MTSTEVYDAGMNHIRSSRLTDAELIYAPSQIALTCLSMASEPAAAEWMRMKGVALEHVIASIRTLIQVQGSVPEVPAVREIDRRLKLCKNPEKIPGSRAFLAKQAEAERKASEKRAKKAEVVQRAMDALDPFGANAGKTQEVLGLDDDDDDDD